MTALGSSGRSLRLRPRGYRARASRPDLLPLECRIVPTHVFTVNSFADGVVANPGAGTALTSDGRITIRSAIMEQNAEGGGGAVIIPAGSYTLSLPGANEDAGGHRRPGHPGPDAGSRRRIRIGDDSWRRN